MSFRRFFLALLLTVLVIIAGAPAVLAQVPTPSGVGGDPIPPGRMPEQTNRQPLPQAIETADGLWMMPADAAERRSDAAQPASARQVNGGPDEFGYTSTATTLNWVDASGGMDTGISASVVSAGPIDIGFPFKYYENSYSRLWVSRHGYLAFNDSDLNNSLSPVPSPETPDNVIAPHWIPSYQAPDYVRYLRGGAAPNRWFVMEWKRQRSDCCAGDPAFDEFTFQAVLHENGDILFQYQDMRIYDGFYCQASGIEDSTGIDGLSITDFCRPVAGNQAVRITRPAPAARLRIFPQHYGAFFHPGETTLTQIPIRNTGELGADVYDLTLDSPWLAVLVHEDGTTPLTDTDGDGVVDTGPVPQGQTKIIGVKVWSSPGAQVGYHNTATVTARSSLAPARYKTVTSRIAVPASFAQVFRDDADVAMSMMLVKPQAQAVRKVTGDWRWGYDMAVAELPNHNLIYVWSKYRCVDSNCTRDTSEIEYTILNPYGETVRPIARLTDNSGASFSTYDYPSGVAVAPNGRVGVVWYRYLWNSSNSQSNYNIYWAALDASGDLAAGPTNVTNNSVWGSSSALNVPRFYNPVIAATGDFRFIVAWVREHRTSAGWITDVWYVVLNNSGGVVRDATKLTDSTTGSNSSRFDSPTATRLTGNRALLTFSGYTYPPGTRDVYYAALGSDGGAQQSVTRLTNGGWANQPDAIQLANGRVVVAWPGDAPANPGEPGWTGEYFNNETLAGNPVVTRTDSTIDFRWDLGSPAAGVNPDHFSARWQGTITVPGGDYTFTMGSDDGSRLWIDGDLVMDYWNTCCQYWNRNVTLSPGAHSVRMEMREIGGAAWAYLGWRDADSPLIKFAVLDANLNRVAGPAAVGSSGAPTGNNYVSVTNDADNHAIFTWMDYQSDSRRNLYYALVNTDGAVLTPATIFQTSQAASPYIFSSYTGNGNTTYSWTPPAGVDNVLSAAPASGYVAPGGMATPLDVRLEGRGGAAATSVRLAVTLDPRLSYVDDTSGVTPTVNGETVTWNLPDLRLYDMRQFQVNTRATGGSFGDSLPVQMQLSAAEPDLTPANNEATVQMRLSRPFYLPLLIRQ
ncbi:MAG: PA14 domain-containing protein [Anaerolineae bacterium]